MSAIARPLPRPTALSRPFWEGCREERLLVQQCSSCGLCFFTPSAFCPHCMSSEHGWVASTGVGEVVTCTTVWRPPTPAFEPPYVVAVVRLEEGHEMLTNIIGAEPNADLVGAPVRVRFHRESEEITLPLFELVTTDGAGE